MILVNNFVSRHMVNQSVRHSFSFAQDAGHDYTGLMMWSGLFSFILVNKNIVIWGE